MLLTGCFDGWVGVYVAAGRLPLFAGWVGVCGAADLLLLQTVGHGSVLTANIPPERTGRMNASVAKVMAQVGAAINNTFHFRHVGPKVTGRNGPCAAGFAEIRAPAGGEWRRPPTQNSFPAARSPRPLSGQRPLVVLPQRLTGLPAVWWWDRLAPGGGGGMAQAASSSITS